ncbi:MAG: SGNH/GDSL hydrolase family protein [Promethearchaeota archaeon]
MAVDWPDLCRIPKHISKKLGVRIQKLSRCLSGARIRFHSSATRLKFKAMVPRPSSYDNFSNLGKCGIDLYIDGLYWQTLYHRSKIEETIRFNEEKMRYFNFYLPLYNGLRKISIETNLEIEDPPAYKSDKPIVFYGSSITQGGCASRPGLSYPNQLERLLNIDIVNLGFSGNGYGQLEIAELISTIDPSLVVLDWGVNLLKLGNGFKLFKERYEKFYQIIRNRNTEIPIIFINFQNFINERTMPGAKEFIERFRNHISRVHDKIVKNGDTNDWLIDGSEIIGMNDFNCTVDGVHPNDLGFLKYTTKIHEFIKEKNILTI